MLRLLVSPTTTIPLPVALCQAFRGSLLPILCTTFMLLAMAPILEYLFLILSKVLFLNSGSSHYLEVSPTNAQCTGAIEVSSYPATYNGYTLYADYSWADCTSGSRQGLWYKLQTYNQNIQVSTCNDNTNFDTELEVYHDCNTFDIFPLLN